MLSARIIACHLATQDDPFKALCPGKPVVPVMSSPEEKEEPSRDSSFKEEIHEDDDAEKENKEVAKVPTETKEKMHREGEVETVTDKGLKDPKSFPQQLFNTMSLKMVEWIGLPPLSNALKFSPDTSLPSTPPKPASLDSSLSPESTPPSPHEQPPKYKFHSNPMELIDTGRLHRDSEPVSQHRHQEILQAPPAQKRRSSNPAQKAVGVITPTPHSNAAKAKITTPGAWGMPLPVAPPPIGAHHKPRSSVSQPLQMTPSRGEKHQASPSQATVCGAGEACVAPPQSLAKLDSEICAALAELCMSGSAGDRKDAGLFARQSLFYVFCTPEALLKSFVAGNAGGEGMDLDMYDVDTALRSSMALVPEWGDVIMRSLWMGLESVFSVSLADRDIARLIALALQALAAIVPRSTPEEWEATRKLRSSGRVSQPGVISEIGFVFENEMAERLMRRLVRAIAYAAMFRNGVVRWLEGYLEKCGKVQVEERRRETERELGEELARGVDRGGGGWGVGVCTLEWSRAVLLKAWDGQESAKMNSVVASCLVLLKILHNDHKAYGLEPEYFHTPILSDRFDAKEVPVQWFNAPVSPSTVHLLDHPFLFPPHSLVTYFRAINLSHMSRAYEQSMTIARLTSQLSANPSLLNPHDETLLRRMHIPLSTYLLIEVNRSTILTDALNQVFRRELRELQRPLKVRFANGEEGVDHGGVQQEFFIIALREALRAEYGMWSTDESTRMAWFNLCTVEPVHKYELIGLLVGLAVYNGVTLPVAFPKIMYMKLLGETPQDIKDIRDGWPGLAKGLRELLEWKGEVADVFMRTYEYSYEAFGRVKHVNMLKAAERGVEFLEETIEKPPPSKDKKKKEEKKEADTMDPLLDLGNWLPAPMPDESDPWLGGLNEVLGVLDREGTSESRGRRYEVTFTEWPGEESGAWEDVDEVARGGAAVGVRVETEAEAEAEAERESKDVTVVVEEKKESEGGQGAQESEDEDDDDDDIHNSMTHDGGVRLFDIPPAPGGEDEVAESGAEVRAEDDLAQDGAEGGSLESPGTPGQAGPAAESSAPDACEDKDKPSPSPVRESLWEEPEEEAELVTNANREQYVKDYISWLTDRSVRRQYQAFEKGFLAVLDRKALSLFTPSSLQSLVEGIQEIDIEGLEKTARYDDGYGPEHKTIRDFWGIVRGYSPEKKRQLLEFVTASDRVPVNGIGSIMFVIQRNGPDSDVSFSTSPKIWIMTDSLGDTEGADQSDLFWKAVVAGVRRPEKAEGETEVGTGERQGFRSSLIVLRGPMVSFIILLPTLPMLGIALHCVLTPLFSCDSDTHSFVRSSMALHCWVGRLVWAKAELAWVVRIGVFLRWGFLSHVVLVCKVVSWLCDWILTLLALFLRWGLFPLYTVLYNGKY